MTLLIFDQFYGHPDFVWNPILAHSKGPKTSFLAILEVLNFDFGKFEQLSNPKFTKIQSLESLKLSKMTFLERLNSPKLDFTQILSGSEMIKFQQSYALTSHFGSSGA